MAVKTGEAGKAAALPVARLIVLLALLAASAASPCRAGLPEIGRLYGEGRLSEARAQAEDLVRREPDKPENRELLVDILISEHRWDDAIRACQEGLAAVPQDVKLRLTMARVYSWTRRFSESVGAYDACIAAQPRLLDCWIEKARVLGWAKRFGPALAAYRAALDQGGVDWLRPEMQAKEALWSQRVFAAEELDLAALEAKPDNQESLMDLAQLYSFSGRHRLAQETYKRLLAVNPYHTAAIRSLEKDEVRDRGLRLSAGMDHWNADSSEREIEVDRIGTFLEAAWGMTEEWTLSAAGERSVYRFDLEDDVAENVVGGRLAYVRGMRGGASARFDWSAYEGASKARASYGAGGWVKPVEGLDLSLAYARENLGTNRANVVDGLSRWALASRGAYALGRVLTVAGDYKYGRVSDGNPFHIAGAELEVTVLERPRKLYAAARFETWSYEHDSSRYYSPGSYQTYAGLIGYRHDFGSEGQVYGAPERYADLRLRLVLDSNRDPELNPSLVLHGDLGPRFYAEASLSLNDSKYYRDKAVYAVLGAHLGR